MTRERTWRVEGTPFDLVKLKFLLLMFLSPIILLKINIGITQLQQHSNILRSWVVVVMVGEYLTSFLAKVTWFTPR